MSNVSKSEESKNSVETIQKFMPPILITILLFLSIDSTILHWLPEIITQLRYPLIFLFIYAPSNAAYNMSHISEFLVPMITVRALLLVWLGEIGIMLVTTYSSVKLNESLFQLIFDVIFLIILGMWLWIGYRFSNAKYSRRIITGIGSLVYLLVLISQISNSKYVAPIYHLGIVTFSICITLVTLQIKTIYVSRRIKRAKLFMIIAFGSLAITSLTMILSPDSNIEFVKLIGRDMWLYSLWLIMFLNSEVLILSKHQTLDAIRGYYEMKSQETDECIVLANLDNYVRSMSEDTIRLIDDDKLTLIWIGLQRS